MSTDRNLDHRILFEPLSLGALTLPNRIVMAPMTRNRAGEGNVPTALSARYYAQRASAGLIVSEATQISPQGVGYVNTPGIHSEAQVLGWRRVTDAVHAAGGRIFAQLWHVGRVSHSDFHDGAPPVAPSPVAADTQVFTPEGFKPADTPRELSIAEIAGIVDDFAAGARNARQAGFDGVEIHGANGYLIDQFLMSGSNRRTDRYGGSVANRTRFLREVVDAVAAAWSADRVGLRLSPNGAFNGMHDDNRAETFGHAAAMLNDAGLAYLHIVDTPPEGQPPLLPLMRETYRGVIMANGGYTRERAAQTIGGGGADLVSFGVLFLANPDLPSRFLLDAPLNEPDQATFYGGTEKGYIDYPLLALAA